MDKSTLNESYKKHKPIFAFVVLGFLLLTVVALYFALGAINQGDLDTRDHASSVDPDTDGIKKMKNLPTGLYTFVDHGAYAGGLKSTAPISREKHKGSHNRFSWRRLNPEEGVYNWSDIDGWLTKLKIGGKTGIFGVMLRCDDDRNGYDLCAPGWALTNKYHPVIEKASNVPSECNINEDKKRLNYLDPGVQRELRKFVIAMGERYRNDPRVDSIEVDIGYWGEANPAGTSTTICDHEAQRAAYIDANYTQEEWAEYANRLVDDYIEGFNDQKPLSVVITGSFGTHWDNALRTQYILDKIDEGHRLGFHHTGMQADFYANNSTGGVGVQYLPQGDMRAYISAFTPMERNWEKAYITCEWHTAYPRSHENLTQDAFIHWTILNALDKHTDAMYPQEQAVNAGTYWWNGGTEWKWKLPDAWDFFNKYAGKDVTQIDEAWIAFRTSMIYHTRQYSSEHHEFYFGDIFDYEFFIEHDLDAPGNSQIGHYAAESDIDGKSNPPWDTNKNDWRGAYNRQTDKAHGKPYMHLNIHDNFIRGGQNKVEVYITYWDRQQGNKWQLNYDSVNGKKSAGVVTLTGQNKWVEKKFILDDAAFNNGINGNDLQIEATNGDTYFHMVRVKKLSSSSPPPENTNSNPIANNDSANVEAGQSVDIDVLANDSDPDNDTLTLQNSFSTPNKGSVEKISSTKLRYRANNDASGTDSFTYTIDDGNGGSDNGVVNITIISDDEDDNGTPPDEEGTTSLQVQAKAQPARNRRDGSYWPIMSIYVDGEKVKEQQVTTEDYKTYSFTLDGDLNIGNIIVGFINDCWPGPCESDRNLYIKNVTINNRTYESSNPKVYSRGVWDGSCSPGYKQSEKLSCNGFFDYRKLADDDNLPPTGSDGNEYLTNPDFNNNGAGWKYWGKSGVNGVPLINQVSIANTIDNGRGCWYQYMDTGKINGKTLNIEAVIKRNKVEWSPFVKFDVRKEGSDRWTYNYKGKYIRLSDSAPVNQFSKATGSITFEDDLAEAKIFFCVYDASSGLNVYLDRLSVKD